MGWVVKAPPPVRFTPNIETRYPFYWRPGGPRADLDGRGKSHPQLGFDPWAFQPAVSFYTD